MPRAQPDVGHARKRGQPQVHSPCGKYKLSPAQITVISSAVRSAQDEGKIKYIGLNNTTLENLQEAWATGVRCFATSPATFRTRRIRTVANIRLHSEAIIPSHARRWLVRFHTLQIRYSMFSRRYVEASILPWCKVPPPPHFSTLLHCDAVLSLSTFRLRSPLAFVSHGHSLHARSAARHLSTPMCRSTESVFWRIRPSARGC